MEAGEDGCGLVHRTRLLAELTGLPAGSGRAVLRRVPGGGPAVPGTARGARDAAHPAFRRPRALPEGAESLPPPLLGPVLRSLRGDGLRGGGRAGGGSRLPAAAVGRDAAVAGAVAAVSVDRQCGPDLVRLRLGVPAAGGGLPRGVPRQRRSGPAGPGAVPPALDPVPGRVRRGAHQDARRRLLAQTHLPRPPPRDTADAGAAELVLPPSAPAAAPGGGGREPPHPARGPLPPVHPAADRHGGRVPDDRDPAVAGALGQLRLAELDHDRAGGRRRWTSRARRRTCPPLRSGTRWWSSPSPRCSWA